MAKKKTQVKPKKEAKKRTVNVEADGQKSPEFNRSDRFTTADW